MTGDPRPRAVGTATGGYLDLTLAEFLGMLAAGRPDPGGGSAAATAVALGASLTAMAARLSQRQLTESRADRLAEEAERIAARAAALIQADADSYQGVLAARRAGRDEPMQVRRDRTAAALSAACDVPMDTVEQAAAVARLATQLIADGNPSLRGDAITGLLLAEAGARAAASLVAINLAAEPVDSRPARAAALVAEIASAAALTSAPATARQHR